MGTMTGTPNTVESEFLLFIAGGWAVCGRAAAGCSGLQSGEMRYKRDWGGGRGNGVLTAGLPIPRIGAGAGAYVGGGRAIKLTLSTPPLFCG